MLKLHNSLKYLFLVASGFLIMSLTVQAAEMTKNERALVKNSLEFNTSEGIVEALGAPTEKLIKPLLSDVEKKNNIDIQGKDNLGAIAADVVKGLLQSPEHLLKISTGYKVIKATVSIESESTTYSAWSKWEKRKLRAPKITVIVYYDNGQKPTENVIVGI